MYKAIFLILFSIIFTQELEVDGDLKVTGNIQSTTIDSLLSLIVQLEQRIIQLECQNTGIIPEGYCDCFFHILDECGVCNGDNTTCQDCAGSPNGDAQQDMCGYCDNDSSNDCVQDCFGEWGGIAEYDICGDCGGDDICNPIDTDGNSYETIQIGDQLWMAENLKTTHYNNGQSLLFGNHGSGAYQYPNNEPNNVDLYGNAYNYYAASDERGLCPGGWHVPSIQDFQILVTFLGGQWEAGGKLKDSGLEYWESPNTGATNESGFTALPAGGAHSDHHFPYFGQSARFWATNESGDNILGLNHTSSTAEITREHALNEGYSIRCIQD